MKVSLKTLQTISNIYSTGVDPWSYGAEEVVKRIGLQLGAVEDVEYTGAKYDDRITVVEVISCDKHPDADKLSLCLIDDSGVVADVDRDDKGLVQVVCGAPNVAEGMKVVWLPPGVVVPSSHGKDEFILESREIRGKVSNGMLASPKELAISQDHEGILEIIDDSPIGTRFKSLYSIDDVVIDCENKMFTHRPDCFGMIGVAREIAGIFGDQYTSPEWYTAPLHHEVTASLPLSIKNEASEVVSRFSAQVVADIEVKKSPLWLQVYLNNIGQNSINNIVDYTNYFMTETAQPLHAFDYDKVKALCSSDPMLFPRMGKKGEKLKLLNGKEIELDESDIVIATDKQAIALGGVMGGSETEVDKDTKNIIIEGANFDMYAIRRTSMRHGIFSDAVTRFNKGQSPLANVAVIAKMTDEVVRYAGGRVASELLDKPTFDLEADNLNHVQVSVDFINARLGTELGAEAIKLLLENVEFEVAQQGRGLAITAPFWRMDIAIPEDIVEEVGRLYGYDKVPVELPIRTSKPSPVNALRTFKQSLRDQLVQAGANEVLTYSFVHGDLLRNTGTDPDKTAYHIRNALSPDLQYYRTSVVSSLLAKVHGNIKAGAGSDTNQFALFEFGKAHVKGHMQDDESELPRQMRRLALVLAADDKTAKTQPGAPYYRAKKFLDYITDNQLTYAPLDTNEHPITSPYQMGRSATVSLGGQILGVTGEIRPQVKTKLKLPDYCAGFELDIDLLMEHMQAKKYKQLSTYPDSNQDITFEIASDMSWDILHTFVDAELRVLSAEEGYDYALQPLDIFQAKKSDVKRVSFRVSLNHHAKTLKTQEVNKLLDHIAKATQEKLQATRI